MDLHYVANGAVGAFDDYCAGYLDPGATGLGYITTLKLSIGMVKADTDIGLERIVSYDRAEKNDAYIGQINIITASSFCGLNGAVWGYHLAKADRLVKGNVKPIKILKRCDNQKVPLIPVEPLLDATERLFGKAEKRRFPPLPGAMVACATKNRTVEGPTKVWCAIALAIAENREKDSNLIVEDTSDTRHFGPEPLDNLKENIGEAILDAVSTNCNLSHFFRVSIHPLNIIFSNKVDILPKSRMHGHIIKFFFNSLSKNSFIIEHDSVHNQHQKKC
jgi:histidine decarboxylase